MNSKKKVAEAFEVVTVLLDYNRGRSAHEGSDIEVRYLTIYAMQNGKYILPSRGGVEYLMQLKGVTNKCSRMGNAL